MEVGEMGRVRIWMQEDRREEGMKEFGSPFQGTEDECHQRGIESLKPQFILHDFNFLK